MIKIMANMNIITFMGIMNEKTNRQIAKRKCIKSEVLDYRLTI